MVGPASGLTCTCGAPHADVVMLRAPGGVVHYAEQSGCSWPGRQTGRSNPSAHWLHGTGQRVRDNMAVVHGLQSCTYKQAPVGDALTT